MKYYDLQKIVENWAWNLHSLAPCSGYFPKDVLVLLCVYFILSFGEEYPRKEVIRIWKKQEIGSLAIPRDRGVLFNADRGKGELKTCLVKTKC